jgi:hypothetical protein
MKRPFFGAHQVPIYGAAPFFIASHGAAIMIKNNLKSGLLVFFLAGLPAVR